MKSLSYEQITPLIYTDIQKKILKHLPQKLGTIKEMLLYSKLPVIITRNDD